MPSFGVAPAFVTYRPFEVVASLSQVLSPLSTECVSHLVGSIASFARVLRKSSMRLDESLAAGKTAALNACSLALVSARIELTQQRLRVV